jgi:hypothetical protein
LQAILSQFSQKNKATTDLTEDAADEEAFKDLDDTVNEEDGEAAKADIEDADELEPSVEASDNAMVDQVATELEEGSADMPPLTRAEINLGRFAITKVCCNHYVRIWNSLRTSSVSFKISPSAGSTVRLFVPISKSHVRKVTPSRP